MLQFPIPISTLEGYLPHRKPALWIDEVLSVEAQRGVCGVRFDPQARYFENGQLTETCFIEWMAQAYGFVRVVQGKAGLLAEAIHAQDAFLVSVKHFTVIERPTELQAGDLFEISIRESHHIGPITMIEGQVHWHGSLVASAQLKVFSRE